MRTDETNLIDPNGVEVFFRRWLPEDDPNAIVLVLHGLSEHSGRYARFAGALVDAGCAVYADDHRGFGRTSATTGRGVTGPGGFEGIVGSIRALHDQALADLGPLPVVVFGHSMGSVLAQAYVQQHSEDVDGLVLSGSLGPAAELEEMAAGLQAMVDAGEGEKPLDALTGFNDAFEPARTPYDWLSRDPAEVDAYIADPMSGDGNQPTTGFMAGFLTLLGEVVTSDAIGGLDTEMPVLFITGEADPVSNGGESVRVLEERYRKAGHEVTAHYYPEARHEVLNETNRDEITADVVAWLRNVVELSG
ncbi:MAG: alpha/beta hydrolase [Acidimicrobiales bacterium]|nr:alpha/beta hydrolase [Acidimicrobiales bacterium]